MIKICNILYSGLGGVSDVCSLLGKLDDNMKSISFFIQVGPKRHHKYITKKKQKTFFVKTFRFVSFFYFYPILKILIKEKPQLVILHNYQILPIFFYKFIFNTKLKILYVQHLSVNLKNFKDNLIIKFSRKIVDRYIVLNKESYYFFIKQLNIKPKKINIIPNALNPIFISSKRKKNNNFKSFKIGMAARINNHKRHDLIIDTIKDKLFKDHDIKCFFAGDGEKVEHLKKKIKNNNNIHYSGSLNTIKLKKWYQKLDIYIQASQGEGHSTSILQAMGMNLPVLGSSVSGIKNFLLPKKNIGIIFHNNRKSLSKKIIFFLNLSKYKKDKMIMSQKKYVLKNFSENKFLNSYKNIIINLFN